MLTGKTKTGFEFRVKESTLDDFELLEKLCAVDDGDAAQAVPAMTMLLGKEQKDELKEHCRDEFGRISSKCMFEEFAEILNSIGPGKNC